MPGRRPPDRAVCAPSEAFFARRVLRRTRIWHRPCCSIPSRRRSPTPFGPTRGRRETHASSAGSLFSDWPAIRAGNEDLVLLFDDKIHLLDEAGRSRDGREVAGGTVMFAHDPSQRATMAVIRASAGIFALSRSGGGLNLELVKSLTPDAGVVAPAPPAGSVAWLDTSDGTVCLRTSKIDQTQSRCVIALNSFLSRVYRPEAQAFKYRGPAGQAVTAAPLLPPNHDPRRPYPVVIDGYPGAGH